MNEHNTVTDQMFKVGAHFGFSRSRRHPSAKAFVFGVKNRVEIIDLEKTADQLAKAQDFAKELSAAGEADSFCRHKAGSARADDTCGAIRRYAVRDGALDRRASHQLPRNQKARCAI